MDLRWKKLCIIIITVLAGIIPTPLISFMGVSELQSDSGNTIRICAGKQQSTELFAFNLFLFIIIVVEFLIISILYFRVSRIIFRKRTFGIHAVKVKTCTSGVGSYAATEEEQGGSAMTVEVGTRESTADDIRVNQSQADQQLSSRKIPRSRIVVVFIAITITFAICFIPTVAIYVVDTSEAEFVLTSSHLISLINVLYRFYSCSTFINPFIYGCMDKKFRTELKITCCFYNREADAQ